MKSHKHMQDLKKHINQFIKERDWEQFHSPKNVAIGLAIEATEVLEIFQWQSDDQSSQLSAEKLQNLKEEIGDVMIYLTELANRFNLDPLECARNKIVLNEQKYPAELVRGKARKYTEYR
jgi:NTP pyrophosphatase (non-canonical NTP hydrolase)